MIVSSSSEVGGVLRAGGGWVVAEGGVGTVEDDVLFSEEEVHGERGRYILQRRCVATAEIEVLRESFNSAEWEWESV